MDNLTMDAIQCKAANPVTRATETEEGMLERSCAYCGKQFKTKNKRKIYCSEVCCHSTQVAKKAKRRESGNADG